MTLQFSQRIAKSKKINLKNNTVVNRNFFSNDEMLNYIKKCDRRMLRIAVAKSYEEMVIVMNYMGDETIIIKYNDKYHFNMICKILDI